MKMITLKAHQWHERRDPDWDPVTAEYAVRYAEGEYCQVECIRRTVERVEQWCRGLRGKRVLDLGGGAGQYTLAFAARGAEVTWHDPSRRYLAIAQRKAEEGHLRFTASLGYLEEAHRFTTQPFDLVFNRICWYYCLDDRQFADLVYALLAPGGCAYLDVCNASWHITHGLYEAPETVLAKQRRRVSHWIYCHCGWKIDEYYMPPHGRVAALFAVKSPAQLLLDYSCAGNDVLLLRKP